MAGLCWRLPCSLERAVVMAAEMTIRRVRIKLATSPEELIYLQGYFAGIDYARKQSLLLFIVAVVLMKWFAWV